MRVRWIGLLILAVAIAAVLLLGGDPQSPGSSGLPPLSATFVGSETCRTCHEQRHETWLDTAHAYSLREADSDSVQGRFDGKTIESSHFFATPFRQDGKYYMRVERKDERLSGVYEVTRIVGRSFEQAYLMTGPQGEWRVLPLCWSIERQEWDQTHEVLADILGMATEFASDYDSRDQIFNHGCGQCHATGYDVGYDPDADRYDSTMLEGAVACESCHGPGSVHAQWHREGGGGLKYVKPARLIHPREDLDATQVLESCGRCHYLHDWKYAIDDDPLVSHHDIAISRNMDRAGFFADGRLSGLNYHGSTQSQSACYLKGKMSCLDCHRMHGGEKFAMKWQENDDAQCAQCHQTVIGQGKEHTFHDDIHCVDCHMPKLLTGVLHFARDHAIRSPEPELTERYGAKNSPNACNVCHQDKTPKWACEWKEKWFDPAPRDLVDDVGIVVDLRRDPQSVSTERLIRTVHRGPERHFFRMTALRELGHRAEPEAQDVILSMLDAGHVELVQVAVELTARRPERTAAPARLRLLEHKTRTVRVEAAYALARLGYRNSGPAMLRASSVLATPGTPSCKTCPSAMRAIRIRCSASS